MRFIFYLDYLLLVSNRGRVSLLISVSNHFSESTDMPTILHIDSSAQGERSITRKLTKRLVERFGPDATVITRDLSQGVPQLSSDVLGALHTPKEEQTADQKALIAPGAEFIDEIKQADTIVIGAPIYNFGPPAELKGWMDHLVRSGVSFNVTPEGYETLLEDTKTYIVYASGGVPIESDVDFLTPWLKMSLGFVGIKSIETIAANNVSADTEAVANAEAAIDALEI